MLKDTRISTPQIISDPESVAEVLGNTAVFSTNGGVVIPSVRERNVRFFKSLSIKHAPLVLKNSLNIFHAIFELIQRKRVGRFSQSNRMQDLRSEFNKYLDKEKRDLFLEASRNWLAGRWQILRKGDEIELCDQLINDYTSNLMFYFVGLDQKRGSEISKLADTALFFNEDPVVCTLAGISYRLKIKKLIQKSPGESRSFLSHLRAHKRYRLNELSDYVCALVSGATTVNYLLGSVASEFLSGKRNGQLEELIKNYPVFEMTRRFVEEDYCLNGLELKKGEEIYIDLKSANSQSHKNFSFGHGAHYCLGSELAKLLTIAFLSFLEQNVTGYKTTEQKMARGFLNGVVCLKIKRVSK